MTTNAFNPGKRSVWTRWLPILALLAICGGRETARAQCPCTWNQNGNNIVNANSGFVGIGTGTNVPVSSLEVALDQGISIVASTGYGVVFGQSMFGSFIGRSARGSLANPTPTLLGDTLTSFGGRGYGGQTGFAQSARAIMAIFASENWTDTAQGAYMTFNTTMSGGTTRTERMRIDHNGNVGIGTTSPTALLDVHGGFFHTTFNTMSMPVSPGGGLSIGWNRSVGNAEVNFYNVYNPSDGTSATTAFQFSNKVTATTANDLLTIFGNGNVTASGTVSGANLSTPGNITATGVISGGNVIAKYQDVAEWVPASHSMPPGTVVALDTAHSNRVIPSSISYDTAVAGVVSAHPGLSLGEAAADKVLVATTGRVRVKVDATSAPIRVGDLLVASDKPGLAMKSQPVDLGGVKLHRPGTVIGKALEPLDKGQGEILVLLTLQ